MRILHHPGDCAVDRPCAVTIGAYDGVHVGHRVVIERVRRVAAEQGLASAVVTFDQHPAAVVRPESAPKVLTDLPQKLELLASTNVDHVLVVHFDQERSEESPEDFVREVLVGCLSARAIIVGHDFHFGYKRRGNVPLLQDLGAELGFDVTGIRLLADEPGGQPVSSTRIRNLLASGSVGEAAALLGRPHQVRGVVARGDARGRELGFPTANVTVPNEIALPADGVYAGWYYRSDGIRRPTALSLGWRPTFYEHAGMSLLEAFLLDFDGDLYDEEAKVEFVAHLRPQVKFESVQELIDQTTRDVATTRRVLGAADAR
ncbi:MAG TPA: bifunctional riboflavin kinase/FAD synthetase [Acidimicrobiales bacterium]|nr:bifunctional riboflavin kinase/FAD synthetase [Acidimicrobiales bacterium]